MSELSKARRAFLWTISVGLLLLGGAWYSYAIRSWRFVVVYFVIETMMWAMGLVASFIMWRRMRRALTAFEPPPPELIAEKLR